MGNRFRNISVRSAKSSVAVSQDRCDLCGALKRRGVQHCQIRYPIRIKIACHEKYRTQTGGNSRASLESPVPISGQDGDVVRAEIRYRQIQLTVGIEICNHHDTRVRACSERPGRLKTAIPIPKHHRDSTQTRGCHGKIEISIIVEISRSERSCATTQGTRLRRFESAIPFAQQNRYARSSCKTCACHSEIRLAISVEVSGNDPSRVDSPQEKSNRGPKGAVTIAEQQGQGGSIRCNDVYRS